VDSFEWVGVNLSTASSLLLFHHEIILSWCKNAWVDNHLPEFIEILFSLRKIKPKNLYHSSGNILTFNGTSRSLGALGRGQDYMNFDENPVVSCVIQTVSVYLFGKDISGT